jgi:hypothetical protein
MALLSTYHKALRKVHMAELRRAAQEHRGSSGFSVTHAYIKELVGTRDAGDGQFDIGRTQKGGAFDLMPSGRSMLNQRIIEDEDEVACEAEEELMDEAIEDSATGESWKYADGLMAAYSTQDVRVFTNGGRVVARMEPEYVVDGIKSIVISVYQQVLTPPLYTIMCIKPPPSIITHVLNPPTSCSSASARRTSCVCSVSPTRTCRWCGRCRCRA